MRMNTGSYSVSENQSGNQHLGWMRLFRFMTIAFALVTLSACSGGAESSLQDYQSRLANLLNEEPETPEMPERIPMPRASALTRSIPETSISLLQSMRLDRCRAGQVIAERNSALGRVRNPGLQLYYEIDVIRALDDCIQSGAVSDSLTETLQEALEHKKQTLPLHIERFLTTDEVIRESLRPGRNVLPTEPAGGAEESIAALRYFAELFELLEEDPLHPAASLENYRANLRALGQSGFLSSHWQSQRLTLGWMRELNRMLSNGADKVGCTQVATPREAEYLQNVMMNIFIGDIQQWLALWDAYHRDIREQLERLEAFTSQSQWQDYLQRLYGDEPGQESHAAQLRIETVRHAQLWQETLRDCRLSPGG